MSSGSASSSALRWLIASSWRSRSARFRPSCSSASALQRRGAGNALVERDRLARRRSAARPPRPAAAAPRRCRAQRQRELQVEPHEGLAAAAVQRAAEVEKAPRWRRPAAWRPSGVTASPLLDLLAQRHQRQPSGGELVGLVEDGQRLGLVAARGRGSWHRLPPRAARFPGAALPAATLSIVALIGAVGLVLEAAGVGDQRRDDRW